MMDVIRARKTIGNQIKSRRDTLGWSRYWLSKVTGVSETQIKSIEDGSASYTIDSLIKLCNALDPIKIDVN